VFWHTRQRACLNISHHHHGLQAFVLAFDSEIIQTHVRQAAFHHIVCRAPTRAARALGMRLCLRPSQCGGGSGRHRIPRKTRSHALTKAPDTLPRALGNLPCSALPTCHGAVGSAELRAAHPCQQRGVPSTGGARCTSNHTLRAPPRAAHAHARVHGRIHQVLPPRLSAAALGGGSQAARRPAQGRASPPRSLLRPLRRLLFEKWPAPPAPPCARRALTANPR
jgi:hypothetical protein